MTEKGKIIALDGQTALVEIQMHSGCESCKVCMFGKKGKSTLKVKNDINAKVGDFVNIEKMTDNSLLALVIALFPPLILMSIGLFIGKFLNLNELIMFAVASAGFILGFVVSSFIDKALKNSPKFKIIMSDYTEQTDPANSAEL